MPFKPGKSGNPAGRPKCIKDRRVELREKLLPHADQLIEMVTTYAKSGDMAAMKIVMDRIIPPLKEEPIHVTIPKIESAADCTQAQAAVVNAVAAGELLPSEGQAMSNLIEGHGDRTGSLCRCGGLVQGRGRHLDCPHPLDAT